jgi:hypothetical protein
MGNSYSITTSNDYMEHADEYRKDEPNLTDNDIKAFNMNKLNYFKTTITICAIYGSFAILMLLIVLFSPAGSSFITEKFKTFTLTFIAGLIIIVTLLVATVTSFKPKVLEAPPYDGNMCPDFWRAELNTVTNRSNDPNRYVKRLQCVPGDKANIEASVSIGSNLATNMTYKFFNSTNGLAKDSLVSGNTTYLDCSKVYPNLLLNASLKDTENNTNKLPYLYSCEYAKKCKIPWTSMCPTVPA